MKKIIKFLIALSIGVSLFWFVMRRAGWEKLNEALTFFKSRPLNFLFERRN